MGTVINVLKNNSREERMKNFTILFAKLVSQREGNRFSQSNLQNSNRKI